MGKVGNHGISQDEQNQRYLEERKSHRYEPIFITDVKANAQGYLDMGRNLRKE